MKSVKNSDKSFIFISREGKTYQPDSESIEPDINNCQVIGFAQGKDEKGALRKLLEDNSFLKRTTFDEVICYRIGLRKEHFFLSEIR